MSERRPFTRGGRHLRLVRPKPFVPPWQLLQFLRMALRPAAGVALVIRSDPGLLRLALSLGLAGLLRGMALLLLGRAPADLRYGALTLLLHLTLPLLLWSVTALLLHLSCRLLGGLGAFRHVAQVTGIAIYVSALFPLTPGAWHLPFLLWLGAVFSQTARQVHDLPFLGALLVAPLPLLAILLLLLAQAAAVP